MIKTGIYGSNITNPSIINNLLDIPELNLVACYSPKPLTTNHSNNLDHITTYSETDSFLNSIDAVIALSPYSATQDIVNFVKHSKHVFFEPDINFYHKDITKLSTIIEEANVKVHAGFPYCYNNLLSASKSFIKRPKFISIKQFVKYQNSNYNVSDLLFMLITNLNVVFSIVKSNIKSVRASAVGSFLNKPELINVNIDFMNGCNVELLCSLLSPVSQHELVFYMNTCNYVFIDMLNGKAEYVSKASNTNYPMLFQETNGDMIIEPILFNQNNGLVEEFSSFAKSIVYNHNSEFGIDILIKTYEVLEKIKEKIKLT